MSISTVSLISRLVLCSLLILILSVFDENNSANAVRGRPRPPLPTRSNYLVREQVSDDSESLEDDRPEGSRGDRETDDIQTWLGDSEEGGLSKEDCIDCAEKKRKLESQLTPEQLKEMRIEDIKRQILRKLRMKARPNVTIPRSLLPAPLSEGELSLKGLDPYPTRDIDDYYGRTEQIIVFPEQSPKRCIIRRSHPSACLYFKLANDLPEGEITSAELWVFKKRDRRDSHNQTFTVIDLPSDNHIYARKRTLVDIRETAVKSDWLKFDVKNAIKRWMHRPNATHGLEVVCRTCSHETHNSPISEEAGQRPFLVLTTDSGKDKSRSKRSTNCGSGTTHCCREPLFVSFRDIGWDDWIIQPSGYTANYCRGSCLEDVAIPLSRTHHTTVMQVLQVMRQRYVQNRNLSPSERAQLTPCCTPTRMSAISLLYLDDDQRLYQKNLPNMVVDTCGCS